jgi:hypothetical protein
MFSALPPESGHRALQSGCPFRARNKTWQRAPDKRKIEPEAEGAARDGPPQSIPVASMSKPGPSTR